MLNARSGKNYGSMRLRLEIFVNHRETSSTAVIDIELRVPAAEGTRRDKTPWVDPRCIEVCWELIH